jgi:hypothetical protein
VLAGGAFAHLLKRVRTARRRALIAAGVMGLAVADLSMVPYVSSEFPLMPRVYASLREDDPRASFYEIHSPRTSAGSPGIENRAVDNLVLVNSPFFYLRMLNDSYLDQPGPETFDLVRNAFFEDYTWLFLTVHDFDYLVLHKWTWDRSPPSPPLRHIRDRLRTAIVFEDEATVVFDRRRMEKPSHAVLLCPQGWRDRIGRRGLYQGIAAQSARIAVFNPSPEQRLVLKGIVSSYQKPRTVRLVGDGRELARWRVEPTEPVIVESPSFRLPAGVHELSLESDGAERPIKPEYAPAEGDTAPFSLWVAALEIAPSDR